MNDGASTQKVRILTHHFEVNGELSIYEGVRLTDYMNESKAFISVTRAEIKCRETQEVIKAGFLNLSKDDIEIIIPEDAIVS